MAADSGHPYEPGKMDIRDHKKTWAMFTVLVKWSLILILGIMVFLALFRTHG